MSALGGTFRTSRDVRLESGMRTKALGLVTVSHTQFAGYAWQIEGRDARGRYMEVDVDAATGEVLNVDR